MSQPSKPKFIEAYETEIIVEIEPISDVQSYKLSWKQYPQPWSEGQSKLVHPPPSSSAPMRVEVADLMPSTTYCLRVIVLDGNGDEVGDFSSDLVVDTEAVGCTPTEKSCCVVQ